MIRLFSTVMMVALFLASVVSHSNADPVLSLGSATAKQGETTPINLSISGDTGTYAGVNARIIFDTDKVSVTGVTKGSGIQAGNFTVDYATKSGGGKYETTVIAYSGTSTFSGSSGALITLNVKVDAGAVSGDYNVQFATTDTHQLINAKHAISNKEGSLSASHTTQNGTLTIGKGFPVVSTFQINNGDAETVSRTVTLNNTATGGPTHYKASENSNFDGAIWQAYSVGPSFTLSAGDGSKTVYFKVKNAGGSESNTAIDSITLKEDSLAVTSFQINNGAADTTNRKVTLNSTATGSPTYYRASESATFAFATWKAYKSNKAIKFTLSKSLGVKTVYFMVKNATEESAVVSDTITVKKALAATVADAGIDQLARRGNVITLDGSRSFSADENVPLTYNWSFVSMPSGVGSLLSDPQSVNPTFLLKKQGNYELQLVVKDCLGIASVPDTVVISTQDTTPVAHAGSDQAIHEVGTRVKLNGSQSYDPDGNALAYQWTFISRPAESVASLDGVYTARSTFMADVPGDYIVQLTVTDGQTQSLPDMVTVSFENVMPVANAGTSMAVKVGETAMLAGDGTDANGDVLSYRWILSSRPGGSLSEITDSTARVATFVPDRAGAYVAQLVVSDGSFDSEPGAIQIQAYTVNTRAITALLEMETRIAVLDSSAFKNGDMQNSLLNKLNAVIANIEAGKYKNAANQLRNDVLPKMGDAEPAEWDGVVWITDRSSQRVWYQEAQDIVKALEMAR